MCPILKQVLLHKNIYVSILLTLSDSGFSTVKYRSLTGTNLKECTGMLTTKYAPNYNKYL